MILHYMLHAGFCYINQLCWQITNVRYDREGDIGKISDALKKVNIYFFSALTQFRLLFLLINDYRAN